MKNFRVYAISNAGSNYFPNNKLVQFSHYLPSQLTLDHNLDWRVAVKSIGLHINIYSLDCPTNEPCLFYVPSFRPDILDAHHDGKSLTLPTNEYEPQSLAHFLQEFFKKHRRIRNVTCTFNDRFKIENPSASPLRLLMREELVDIMRLPKEDFLNWNGNRYFQIKVPRRSVLEGQATEYFIFPQVYNVHCNFVTPQQFGENFEQIIYHGLIPVESKGTYFYHYVKTPRYFEVKTANLNRIDIKITGEDGKLLKLASGQSTIVELEFNSMESFTQTYITIKNDRNQKSSDFVGKLAAALSTEKCEICLHSLILPNSIMNIKDTLCKFPIICIVEEYHTEGETAVEKDHFANVHEDLQSNNILDLLKSTHRRKRQIKSVVQKKIYIEPGFYASISQLCKAINELLPADIAFEEQNGHVSIKLVNAERGAWIFLPNRLSDILGYEAEHSGYHIVSLNTKDKIQKQSLPKPSQIHKYYPAYCSVYCSDIESTIMGDNFYQLLRISPLSPHIKGQFQFCEYSVLEFVPLKVGFLSNLHIYLRDPSGDLLQFTNDTSPVTASLIIRRRQEK